MNKKAPSAQTRAAMAEARAMAVEIHMPAKSPHRMLSQPLSRKARP